VSIFSDLNQLRDISLERDYADLCGITETELLKVLVPEVDALAAQLGVDRAACVSRLRARYDGYCFHPDGPGEEGGLVRRVYNPYSLISVLQKRSLGSYWFETGTPNFLVRRMRDAGLEPKRLVDGSIYVEEVLLSDYRADDPDPVPLLFQAGYLTIREYDAIAGEYGLVVPNGEVEWGLFKSLLPMEELQSKESSHSQTSEWNHYDTVWSAISRDRRAEDHKERRGSLSFLVDAVG
jgi:hypothetical protein